MNMLIGIPFREPIVIGVYYLFMPVPLRDDRLETLAAAGVAPQETPLTLEKVTSET